MAPVSKRTEMINAPVEALWEVITDVERYPEFLKEVKNVKVEKVEGNRKTATYTVDIVKTIRYTLVLTEDKPRRLTWTMSKGEMMSKNDGSWELRDEGGGRCSALYTVDIKFGLLVPSSIVGMLTVVNLPKMLDAFKKRAESLAAKKKT